MAAQHSMMLLVVLLFVSCIISSSTYKYFPVARVRVALKANAAIADSLTTKERIQRLINTNKIVLFMKGEKDRPQCGFSNTACKILREANVPFEAVNVLADQAMRSEIKEFSAWPTIPQLYVHGEFVGGSDIMLEMHKSGEFAQMIRSAQTEENDVCSDGKAKDEG